MTVQALTPFTVEHALELQFVRDAGFVGSRLFYTVARIEDASRESHSLWVCDRDESAPRQIGAELADLSKPAPSPDGRTFALLADVEGRTQVNLVDVDGGPVRPLTALPQGVAGAPTWSPDGRLVAFTAGPAVERDPSLPYRVDRATYRFDGLGYLDDVVQDVYVVEVASGAVRQLTADRCMNADPQWSPDGRLLSYLVSFPPDRAWTSRPALHLVDVASGEARAVVDAWGGVDEAAWLPDGGQIAFVARHNASYVMRSKFDIWTVDVAGGEPECRTSGMAAGVGARIQTDLPIEGELYGPRLLVRGDAAFVSARVRGNVGIYRIALRGPESVEPAVDGTGSSFLMDVDSEGDVLHLRTSFVDPPELALGATPITTLNEPLLDATARPDVHELSVTAPDGMKTDAWALTPPREAGPWPTVLCIHGGPYSGFGNAYVIDFQLLVGAGFAVVFHNFRGSYGYGDEFMQRITGGWGPAGSIDHHAAIDEAIRAGIADPERLGVFGLSYGGFSACWLTGTSRRFGAAVAENPVNNWVTAFGIADMDWWVEAELGGTPYDRPDEYRELSPLTYAPASTTPMLFIVGEQDMRCRPAESEQFYRVLKQNGVPTEMLRLPDSSHMGSATGPIAARTAQNEALVEWFTRYLSPEARP